MNTKHIRLQNSHVNDDQLDNKCCHKTILRDWRYCGKKLYSGRSQHAIHQI